MRAVGLFVVFAIVSLASAQLPEEEEYQRKLKDYEEKKAIYDRHQAIANVPVMASNDLVPKVPVHQIPAGYAELLLPTYTGIPVQFHALGDPVIVPEVVSAPTAAFRGPATSSVAVRATPLRPGPQSLSDKRPAPSNVSVRTTVQVPARQVATVTSVTAPRRPPELLLFSNARVSLPSLAQRFGFLASPLPTRVQVDAFGPRRPS